MIKLFTKARILSKPRPRFSGTSKHVFIPSNYKELKRELVKEFRNQFQQDTFDGAVSVSVHFISPRKRQGDLEQLFGTIADALETAGVVYDDVQFSQIYITHELGEEHLCVIQLEELPNPCEQFYVDKVTRKKV